MHPDRMQTRRPHRGRSPVADRTASEVRHRLRSCASPPRGAAVHRSRGSTCDSRKPISGRAAFIEPDPGRTAYHEANQALVAVVLRSTSTPRGAPGSVSVSCVNGRVAYVEASE